MKRIVALLVALMLVLVQFGAFAEMGVQLISGPEEETEPVSLDDLKLGIEATIDGFAVLKGISFEIEDGLGYYDGSYRGYNSGADADFAIFQLDILNTTHAAKNYLATCEVTAVYDDSYEYAGWAYQYNYDLREGYVMKDKTIDIEPMYTGHYCFGCTLPNAIVNSKAPLKMIIKLDGNEITYNIRK